MPINALKTWLLGDKEDYLTAEQTIITKDNEYKVCSLKHSELQNFIYGSINRFDLENDE